MYIFKYKRDEDSHRFSAQKSITMKVDEHADLSDILLNFGCFLKACGFCFKGELEIINEYFDEPTDMSSCEANCSCQDTDEDAVKYEEDSIGNE